MRKELESKEINYELLEQIKATKMKEPLLPEHPFIKLCDGEMRRKENTKLKLKLQN
mgnify:CR=1 FL=1